MAGSFEQVLDHIREKATSEAAKGARFERLMKRYFEADPIYRQRFEKVQMWSDWAEMAVEKGWLPNRQDRGIDLVATLPDGNFCAIQCKCYADTTSVTKKHVDSFISESNRAHFTERILVNTGGKWTASALRTVQNTAPRCQVLNFRKLADSPIDWPDLATDDPESLSVRRGTYKLRQHQRAALEAVQDGLQEHARGRLIMACGTGKTYTALRIAEAVAGRGGRVLYLVPSISLMQQSMREWAEQQRIPHRYIGICSDVRAGRTGEDAPIEDLEIPVTTAPTRLRRAIAAEAPAALKVVFCTYQSLQLVVGAQDSGAPEFDLVLCDEAHRTTGVDRPKGRTSHFLLVHAQTRVRAAKRLYMTATPRLYTAGVKSKAARHDIEVFSMDDEQIYGPEFHRLQFSKAVRRGLLADYKVVIIAVRETGAERLLRDLLEKEGKKRKLNLGEAALVAGCWRALHDPENAVSKGGRPARLRRAIAFTNVIATSKRFATHWEAFVDGIIAQLPEGERGEALRCEAKHIDGRNNALDRRRRIDWLKGSAGAACRILSNARCLSEGIDVPALDAVLFVSARNSQVDIVQAVGRVMRRSPGKENGYIILPVPVQEGVPAEEALNDNKRWKAVWGVLRALRAHDDRFNAEINKLDLNDSPGGRIIFGGDVDPPDLPFPPLDVPPEAIYAQIVEKCGDRKYWENWAKDVAEIFSRLVTRLEGLLDKGGNEGLSERFDAFLGALRKSINDSVDRDSAVRMMAQHVLTQPVFEALFEGYDFARSNPVAAALDGLHREFGKFGLAEETRNLEGFYESVRLRARGLDNSAARQRVLMELYEKFFKTAMKKDADRLGIVYTPVEVVDFILASADAALREEFGRSLSDEGVHVLDPFTGTGIFLVRLLMGDIIRDKDLQRKYRDELHANEIVLLAYYIAAVHIEEAYRGRAGGGYEPFNGIVLCDTFNLRADSEGFGRDWLPGNSERTDRQQGLPIEVVVGNPPWSVGQRSSADNNPNVEYPELKRRVRETYAASSGMTNKNSLYDSYKMAIRWASDRIEKRGVIALVTNGSWIDGNADSGLRACLAEEFSSIWVLNLRGNAWTSGDRRQSEGDNVFAQGSKAPVAITILAANPEAKHEGCRILYRDIGDYLKRERKLEILREAGSIEGIDDWIEIKPDKHDDWIGQRDPAFEEFQPLGSKAAKAGKSGAAVFRLYSRGLATCRDAYLYNSSRSDCAENARRAVEDYRGALSEMKAHPHRSVDRVVRQWSGNLRWDRELKNNLKREREITYSGARIRHTQYRPFVKQHCYVEYGLVSMKYQQDRIFPMPTSPDRLTHDLANLAICVPGIGSKKPFSVLAVDRMPDVQLMFNGQCFPRWTYRQQQGGPDGTELFERGLERVDNITDAALSALRRHYGADGITKDSIFEYVYGVLHAPAYRERFADDLSKEIPRVPMATDFGTFAKAGRALMDLHVNYETCTEYPLDLCVDGPVDDADRYRIGKKMTWEDKGGKTTLKVNDHVKIGEIPPEAHRYRVNGYTPLEWFINRYLIKEKPKDGIVNDPNGWFDDPRDLISAIRRIVHVSVETVRIVEGLPDPCPSAG